MVNMIFLRLWELRRFSLVLLRFLDSLEAMHTWRSGYDRFTEYIRILAMWQKVYKKYIFRVIFDIRDLLGDALAMIRSMRKKIPQFLDRVMWSKRVFLYGQRLWCLHTQMRTMIFLLIDRAISDSVFITWVLRRVWYCS